MNRQTLYRLFAKVFAARLALLAGLLALSLASVAAAQTEPAGLSTDERTRLDNAIGRLIQAGDLQGALDLFQSSNPSRADEFFFIGRVLKAQGRLDEAIDAFRRALLLDPNLLNARRELAVTLFEARQFRAATFHLNLLLEIDGNENMRETYRQILSRIDQIRPFTIRGTASLAPSTNINRGSTSATFDTDLGTFTIESQAESGVGLQLGFVTTARHTISDRARLVLNFSASRTVYTVPDANRTDGTISVAYERTSQDTAWFVGPLFRRGARADDSDVSTFGWSAGLTRRLSPELLAQFSVLRENRDFDNFDTQDGIFFATSGTLTRQVRPSLSFSGGLTVERSAPEAEHLRYTGLAVNAGVNQSWDNGLTALLGASVGRREFDGIFPLTTFEREDEFVRLSLDLRAPILDVAGYAPQLLCSYTINQSNISLYEYDAAECRLGIFRNF